MINKIETAQRIGLHILNEIEKMQQEKKDFGQELVVPFRIPTKSDEPPWIFSVKVQMPRYSVINNDGTISSFTMAEYHGWSTNT